MDETGDYPVNDEQARRGRRMAARQAIRPADSEAEMHTLAALGDRGARGDLWAKSDGTEQTLMARYPIADKYGIGAEAKVVRYVEDRYDA